MQKVTSHKHVTYFTALHPVIIGMGFSKKIPALKLIQAINNILQEHQYRATDIAIPSFKQNDPNFIEFKELTPFPIHLIPQETLLALQPQCSNFSQTAYHHTGLGAVAEACVLALLHKNGRLLIPKMIYNKISFSIAIKGDPL